MSEKKTPKTSLEAQKAAYEGAFEAAYARLNPEQKRAVDTIEGPVMIIAGPGTGKTQVLALRIANILRTTDAAPSSILALTFTESGVASMRARLVSLIGPRGYEVRINTFHGFCNTIIAKYPERFPRIVGSVPIAEIDAFGHIEHILDHGTFALLRPPHYPYLYVRDIKGTISDVKRENISPSDLRDLLKKERDALLSADDLYHEKGAHKGKMKGVYSDAFKKLDKADEFACVYEAYEDTLMREHAYDFEDTILEVVRMLKEDEEMKLMLEEEHQYILADEHQDANGAQNKLLELLSDFHDAPNLFIVGDEKQAIYRFQGASLENFLYFKKQYPSAVSIELKSNYRSTQVVLDAAHDVIMPSEGHELTPRPRLSAHAGHAHAPVSLVVASNEEAELSHLVSSIGTLIREGVPHEEIAVLTRRNSDGSIIARRLLERGIPSVLQSDAHVLETPLIRSFLTLLRAVAYFGDSAYLYPVLYAPFIQVNNLDLFKLTSGGEYSLYETLAFPHRLEAKGIEDIEAFHTIYTKLDQAATYAKRKTLPETIEYIATLFEVFPYIMGTGERYEHIEYMRTLFGFIESLARTHKEYSLRECMSVFDKAQEYGTPVMRGLESSVGAVQLMTVHRSKGMEFDHVFIPMMHEGRWGASRMNAKITLPIRGYKAETNLDDERRLLYVAMTRARKTLTLSYAEHSVDGKPQTASRFVHDINEAHLEVREVVDVVTSTTTIVTDASLVFSEKEREYLRMRLRTQGLSVSALNNYLESPWKYFFQNLIRIPSHKEPHQYYGTAIDVALKFKTRAEAQSGEVNVEDVVSEFVRVLRSSPLSSVDQKTYEAKGRNALTLYLKEYPVSPAVSLEAAVHMKVLFETSSKLIPELELKGEFDRLEHVMDGVVRVVDFKTGSPKTRNYILGETKDSNGNYKRQLDFYALLASLDNRGRKVTEGIIDFVEPDEKGRFHRESFAITTEDIERIKETIRRVVEEIATFTFLDTPCDSDVWSKEGCALVAAVKSRS